MFSFVKSYSSVFFLASTFEVTNSRWKSGDSIHPYSNSLLFLGFSYSHSCNVCVLLIRSKTVVHFDFMWHFTHLSVISCF